MRVRVVEPPASAVTLEEAKQHLKVLHDRENALISQMVAAATGHLDGPQGWLGRALAPQVLELQAPLPCGRPRLPFPPMIALQSVSWLDGDDAEQTADPGDFYLTGSEGNVLALAADSWPWRNGSRREDALRVRYRAGYAADPEASEPTPAVPAPIKAAILLMTGDLFLNRETVAFGAAATAVPMSTTVERLLTPYRVWA